ncbi:methionine adenosyltransferase [Columbia Basin potato purple top phytoplasma]|uniref:Methionine adenosyltransferase n=1 Tax=Columbia Basin potato purple top phytoplasma TaxID=307134 RepID=A0ABT5L918_9MOLU|nr:methionine adenosyltransferase [Columbia Basin potato purple top phytoplasma]MDC9032109.1 methionine adenosyltransferase [Columbia Basin potato purple top phytoplasma]
MKKFSSESVTKGHPDKIADQISDALLDAFLKGDPESKVAIETVVTKQKVIILGEIKTSFKLSSEQIKQIVKNVVKDIGYDREKENFCYHNLSILNFLHEQSIELSNIIGKGAGDQGLMFGYASNETSLFLPLNFFLARSLSLKLTEVRENKILPFLRPDGKTQVTLVHDEKNKPLYIDSIVISAQHEENITQNFLQKNILQHVINPVIDPKLITDKTNFYINPSGSFVIGGPFADTGLTGRKIIQDAYGGEIRHGGGCFSGKDASKVDRSGAYMARYLAKNIVAAGLCDKCEIQISYVIAFDKPVSFFINTFGTNKVSEFLILKMIEENFDLTPRGIIKKLNLKKPLFRITSCEGHFGRNDDLFSWERIDQINLFSQLLKKQ